jgi:hypothetical protein
MTEQPLSIAERRKRREDFLKALYDVTGGDVGSIVNFHELGAELGWSHGASWDVRSYLGREALIQGVTGAGGISITHKGVNLVESWAEGRHERFHPEEAPANEIHIENAVNTQIQQGSHGSSQEMTVSDQTVGELHAFVGELRGALPDLGLPEADQEELRAQLTTVEAQLASRKTRWAVVKAALTDIQEVIKAATAIGAAASPILSTLGRLLGAF